MSVKLHIEIEGPIGPDDKDILTGATMILLALAQRYAEPDPSEPQPCGDLEMLTYPPKTLAEASGRVCVGEVGHKGRHKYRDLTPRAGGLN